MSRLLDETRGVLDHAIAVFADDPYAVGALTAQRARLGGPLRVALAGSVKAGKSTLLNALVGEQIAPTGVGECTRVTTHYADAPSPRIGVTYRGLRREGDPAELPALHRRGSLVIETERLDLARVAALHVDWPSQHLREVTLIDTPGVDSAVSRSVWGSAEQSPEDVIDCVVHLVRHLHEPDVAFLESYGDRVAENVGAAGTLVVLSRADEVGGGRIDAVMAAQQVARRYRTDPALRSWCATTTTVAGLLAETARTLRGVEFTALRTLARLDRTELEAQLLTADRFVQASGVLPSGTRLALLDRFGLFGVRLATSLLRRGVDDSAALAAELARRSGLDDLRAILDRRFLARRDVFQARSALLAVERFLARARSSFPTTGVAGSRPSPAPRAAVPRVPDVAVLAALAEDVERVRSGAHGIVELDVLTRLRRRPLDVPGRGADLTEEAERLLGDQGPEPAARLGVAEDTGASELRAVALAALGRWRGHAENPLAAPETAETAQVVVRSLEGVLAELPRLVGVG
ncbi:dynamin family protein [Actinomycetospora termitidis]|uniref:Dynamin family protein n=1 Tax=Actinomycetospora termitidis TaxID=3053470 RepID=A0ABT7MHD4_9PSEU|nr:dynamin family protein [Actinomycetospora sp. Odt1-22]MDL5159342.1 dynamin family protein [Actinomycetospora sp. Odt1-22]